MTTYSELVASVERAVAKDDIFLTDEQINHVVHDAYESIQRQWEHAEIMKRTRDNLRKVFGAL